MHNNRNRRIYKPKQLKTSVTDVCLFEMGGYQIFKIDTISIRILLTISNVEQTPNAVRQDDVSAYSLVSVYRDN